jgi:hypothetical protein
MIDGEGSVRIADFGLAVAAGDVTATHAGTPQYMAPEQLAGGQASVKTDIYALGLVLFELFTGKRAYDAKTLNELVAMHRSGTVSTPSSVVRDLDPAIERVILRCLEHDPALRPRSALAVAAALPGGDPLAAALAAGETPSPEMVAAAGETSALRPAIGLSLLAVIMVGLIATAALSDRTLLIAQIPFAKTPDALEDRAKDIVAKLGYTERPADTARGFFLLNDYIVYVARTDRSPSRWDGLKSGAFPSLRFWYRTSPRALETLGTDWNPTFGDPPMTVSNMVSLMLDTEGRLTQFTAVPPQVDETPSTATADWAKLFDAAGLDRTAFKPATPLWVPNTYTDQRAAWEGPLPGRSDIRLRVEAAAYRGRPAFFQVVGPWTRPARMTQEPPGVTARFLRFGVGLIILAVLCGALALARHNLRSGRGDRRGAMRVALSVVVLMTASWILGARHSTELLTEVNSFLDDFLGGQLLNAGIVWLVYISLEPYVRRYCPELLMSWTRLLGGRLRDPRVGRDTLVGIAGGVGITFATLAAMLLPPVLGLAGPPPRTASLQWLLGTGNAIAALLRMPSNALLNTLIITLVFVVMRVIVKRVWLAATIAGAMYGFLITSGFGVDMLGLAVALAITLSAIYMVVLVRFGVLAEVVTFFTGYVLGQGLFTADLSKVYASTGMFLLFLVSGLACFGFWASRDREPIFDGVLTGIGM